MKLFEWLPIISSFSEGREIGDVANKTNILKGAPFNDQFMDYEFGDSAIHKPLTQYHTQG
jgi:hypothetical protein